MTNCVSGLQHPPKLIVSRTARNRVFMAHTPTGSPQMNHKSNFHRHSLHLRAALESVSAAHSKKFEGEGYAHLLEPSCKKNLFVDDRPGTHPFDREISARN